MIVIPFEKFIRRGNKRSHRGKEKKTLKNKKRSNKINKPRSENRRIKESDDVDHSWREIFERRVRARVDFDCGDLDNAVVAWL